jgi:hypothetical protein
MLRPTISRAEAMAHLGIQKSKLHELMTLGRRFRGVHPLRGGLWPWYRVTHKNVRLEEAAITRHLEHVQRLACDPIYAARMAAAAAKLGDGPSRAALYFSARKAAA